MYGRAHPLFRRDDSSPEEESEGDQYYERTRGGGPRPPGGPGGPGGGGGGGGNLSDSAEEEARYQPAPGRGRRPGQGGGGGGGSDGGIRQHPIKKKLFRPVTLPHIDRRRNKGSMDQQQAEALEREERDARARTIGPGVTVHSMEPLPDPPLEDDPVDMWTVRPRQNSGISKLQRRRKYDSYVGTLEADRLKRLDEHLLQRAATYDEEEEEEEGDEEEEQGYGRDEEEGVFVRGCGRYGGEQDEDDGDIRTREERGRKRAAAKVVNVRRPRSASPRRERLCEEDIEDDEECKNPAALPYHKRRDSYRQQPFAKHTLHDLVAAPAPPPPAGSRYSSRHVPNPRHSQKYPEPMVDDDDDDSSAAAPYYPQDSPNQHNNVFGPLPRVRFYRDGVTNVAPPDDPSFSQVAVSSDGRRRKTSAELAAEAARAGDRSLGVSWLYGLDETGGKQKGGVVGGGKGAAASGEKHQRTLLEWVDRSQRVTGDTERVARAALYLQDAIDTRPPRHQSRGLLTVRAYHISKGALWSGLVVAAAVLHLLLALWEPPRSLPNSHPYHDSLNRHTLRSAYETSQHLLGLECFLIMIYVLDLALEVFALGPSTFFTLSPPPRVIKGMNRTSAWANRTWSQVRFVVVVLFLFDVSANLNGGISAHFTRCLRPLFLICVCDPLKRWAVLLYKLLTQLRDVVICITIVLSLFSLTGLILFSETNYYANGLRFQNFSNFVNSFISLYVLLTTQNFNDLLDPAYSADPSHSTPLYFFFFASFVVVLVLFLANLALPRVYWVFQSFQRAQAYQARKNERLALLLSFRCLDVEQRGYICLNQFRDLLRFLRPEFFDAQSGYEKESYMGATEHMFLELAKDHPGRIYPSNYFRACEVILMDFYPCAATLPRQGAQSDDFPARQRSFLRDVVFESRWAELVSLVILLLTLFFLSFYGSPDIDKDQLRDYSYFVIVLFTVEVLLKIWAYGPRTFFGRVENTIDAVVIGAAFFSIMVYGCSKHNSPIRRSEQLANLGLLFLTFRGVRLFPKCEIFAKFQCAFTVLPFFFFSFVLSLLLVYSWAAIGMALFSGLANRPTTTDFGRLPSVNNFESFWSASITLFQVAATHDWYRTMYMWMDLADTCWTALYFLLFHAVANVVAVQLTMALFLDAFLSFDGKRWLEAEDDEDTGAATTGNDKGGPGGPSSSEDDSDGPRLIVPEAPEQPPDDQDGMLPGAATSRAAAALDPSSPASSSATLPYPHLPQQHGRLPGVAGASSSPVGAPTVQPHHHHRLSSLNGGYKAMVV